MNPKQRFNLAWSAIRANVLWWNMSGRYKRHARPIIESARKHTLDGDWLAARYALRSRRLDPMPFSVWAKQRDSRWAILNRPY